MTEAATTSQPDVAAVERVVDELRVLVERLDPVVVSYADSRTFSVLLGAAQRLALAGRARMAMHIGRWTPWTREGACAEERLAELPTEAPVGAVERERLVDALHDQIALVQGQINALEGELVQLAAAGAAMGVPDDAGTGSLGRWLAWRTGSAPTRAGQLARLTERLDELPATSAALVAGELSLDQAAVIARFSPPYAEADAADFARSATPGQLRRWLAKYKFGDDEKPRPERPFELSFGYGEDGEFWLRGRLPAAVGAQIESALAAHKDALMNEWKRTGGRSELPDLDHPCGAGAGTLPSWLDAILRMAERSLVAEAADRPHYRRTQAWVHLDVDAKRAWLHMGPVLSDAERRLLTCDATFRAVYERCGIPIGVGRSSHEIPDRVRSLVEARDGGCRTPGCHARYVQIHHVQHWEDGGPTETWNLIGLCPRCHRSHHLGLLGIAGTNADDPNGITFSDRWRRPLPEVGRAEPPPPDRPVRLPGVDAYTCPTGGRLQSWAIHFPPSPTVRA